MRYLLILLFFLTVGTAYAQDYVKYNVQKGETVISIAKKNKITPYDIYRLNPDARNGINEGATLLLPKPGSQPVAAPKKEQPTKVANIIHEVQPKETLYSISKKYDVTIPELEKANADKLKEGLKAGEQLIIPIKGSGVAAQIDIAEKKDEGKNVDPYIYHTVEQGETKYGIAKQYNISLQLLEELNPEVVEVLPLGYKLKLIKKSAITEDIHGVGQPEYVTYVVKPKETFYSLSKVTGLTEEKILEMNPAAKEGLKEGMTLIFPSGTQLELVSTPKKRSLLDSLYKENSKELVILLPFNADKITSDTLRSEKLRTDQLLNLTLDFYAGALMAIDSAKTLGLPLKVKILDSGEAKNSGYSLLSSLSNTDAVVGPFFPVNVESTAALLSSKKIPVISPLSKELGKPYANVYQSVPTDETLKKAMLEYLKATKGNVIAIVDPKKASSKQFILQNYPTIKFLPLNADGNLNLASLTAMMDRNKTNYVLLETEKAGTMLSVTKALTEAQGTYNIQLAVLERNQTFDFDEVPLDRLKALKMLYPSISKSNDSPEAEQFRKAFKEKNNIMPNQFAVRGFDITFDTILRLFQQQPFQDIMARAASEQLNNKFVYITENGSNYNRGVYILQYDEGYTIKTVQ
ncbi:LysM peptidoglycan-binding domain-containing protein [Flavobacterium rhizosphaerae]|uniref:LysM peptidoglycan-binding domain-containing protein n=1 Tax=Flavobacterium rhizosphaerae TaxID=3163298 RepID=A0ABW8YUZ3_9FLAO